jgi:hypothetical protein
MKTVIATTNWTLIAAAAFGIWFLSAHFYLGTEESHQELKAELPKSFFIRSTIQLVLSTTFSVLLWLANWLFVFFTKSPDKQYPLKIAGIAFIICMLSGLIGVADFFWW